MQADELDHIRADVRQAILEARQHDPTVTLEILWRLFNAIGRVALAGTGHSSLVGPTTPGAFHLCCRCYPDSWSEHLLRDVQLRAVSKVPYGEPVHEDPPSDPEDRL